MEFCRDTFQWGDYIHKAWETWHSDPNGVLLVAEIRPGYTDLHEEYQNNAVISCDEKSTCLKTSKVVGIAHAHLSPERTQLWIEGIRIDTKYRRMRIASMLIERMINYGMEIDSNIREAAAITAESNTASRSMLEKNKFQKRARWNYYTSQKENNNHQTTIDNSAIGMPPTFESNKSCASNGDISTCCINAEVSFASLGDIEEITAFLSRSRTFIYSGRRYVHSWKWYKLNLENSKILELTVDKRIIIVRGRGFQKIRGLAITNNHRRQNDAAKGIKAETQGGKRTTSEKGAVGHNENNDDGEEEVDDYDDKSSSFQLVYLDAPASASLENLLYFILNRVISSGKFDRIQLFVPDRMYQENSSFYEVADVLTKFGFSKSEQFLLYVRNI